MIVVIAATVTKVLGAAAMKVAVEVTVVDEIMVEAEVVVVRLQQ